MVIPIESAAYFLTVRATVVSSIYGKHCTKYLLRRSPSSCQIVFTLFHTGLNIQDSGGSSVMEVWDKRRFRLLQKCSIH